MNFKGRIASWFIVGLLFPIIIWITQGWEYGLWIWPTCVTVIFGGYELWLRR